MRYHLTLLGTIVIAVLSSRAWALQTETHGLHCVPAPGKVVIDGDLGDWDLSGQTLMCYDVATLRDVYSANIALMCDNDNLYVGIHWKAPNPMANSHDPRYQADRGWAGDCVQMRIKTDRISHVSAWYFAGKQEPCIGIQYGKSDKEPITDANKQIFRTTGWQMQEGAAMAFKKDADGHGYVQEIQLPWALISNGGRPKTGEAFRIGFELLWGGADWPVHRYADNLAEGCSSREFFWTSVNNWGPVWMDKQGHVQVAPPDWQMQLEQEAPKGSVAITYNLPKDSRVTLAIDDGSGRRVRNLLAAAERKAGANTDYWDALDDAGNAVSPGSYRVLGLTHDGLHLNYVISFASPGHPGWQTADGKGSYYSDHTAPEAAAAGTDMMALACPMGESGQHLIGVDLNGQRQWGLANRAAFGGGRIAIATDGKVLYVANGANGHGGGTYTIWRCDMHTGAYAPWDRKDPKGDAVLDLSISNTGGASNCRGIALHKGELAVPVGDERRLMILDASTGATRRNFPDMPGDMMGVAFNATGTLYLLTSHEVFAINMEGGRTPLIQGLDDAQGIACDAAGNIYVSQRGGKQDVQVFSAQGRAVRTIGKPGGRQEYGFYDPSGMLNPKGLAVDAKGRVWVTEENFRPKRTSVWGPDGSLALDLVGCTRYSQAGIINAADPTRGFSEGVEYKLDPAKGTFKPLYILKPADGLGGGLGTETRVVKVEGHEYLHLSGSENGSGSNWIFERQGDGSWRNVMALGVAGNGGITAGHGGKTFLWTDNNNDGRASADEVQYSDMGQGKCYWGQMIGEDLTLPVYSWDGWYILKANGLGEGGVPRYSLGSVTHLGSSMGPDWEGMVVAGRDRYYHNTKPNLYAVDTSGRVLWTYPNPWCSVHGSHDAPAAGPGLLIGPSRFYGTAYVNADAGEIVYLNGNLGQNFIFTQDGLWVQSLYNDCRGAFDTPAQAVRGMSVDAMTAGGESFYGGFAKASDGKYYTVGGGTSAVVSEVTGLQSLHRFNASCNVSEADVQKGLQLKAERNTVKNLKRSYTIHPGSLAAGGDPDSWKMNEGSIKIVGSRPLAEVKASYDASTLYLAYHVHAGHKLQNAGQNDQLMFKTGDCVDLMLRANGSAQGADPQSGDLRLLMTLKGGQPLAVLYRPAGPGSAAADFSSPSRTVHMADCEVVNFPITVAETKDGYTLAAAVPLRVLGVGSLDAKTLRGDFGVLSADSSGRICTARTYWSNKTTNNVNDVPDEAMLSPGQWAELNFSGK